MREEESHERWEWAAAAHLGNQLQKTRRGLKHVGPPWGPLPAHLEVVTQHHVCPLWLDLAPAFPLLSSPPTQPVLVGVPPALDVAPFLHHFSRSALSSEE